MGFDLQKHPPAAKAVTFLCRDFGTTEVVPFHDRCQISTTSEVVPVHDRRKE
jgi:hypothetical protein